MENKDEKIKEFIQEFREIRNQAKQEYNLVVKPAYKRLREKIAELENHSQDEQEQINSGLPNVKNEGVVNAISSSDDKHPDAHKGYVSLAEVGKIFDNIKLKCASFVSAGAICSVIDEEKKRLVFNEKRRNN